MHVHPSSRSLPFYCWPAIDLPAVLACPYLHTIGRRAHGQRAHAPPLVCKWVGGWRFEGTPKERYFYPGPCAQRAYVPTDSHHDSSAIQIETTMSLLSRFSQAFRRSLLGWQSEAARIMRMEVSATENATQSQLFYKINNSADLSQIATGSDSDIGGLSRCHMSLEHDDPGQEKTPASFGRFYGTLSSQVPRGSALERSGYAAFRNKVGWLGFAAVLLVSRSLSLSLSLSL